MPRKDLDDWLAKCDTVIAESLALIRNPDIAEARWQAERAAKKRGQADKPRTLGLMD